MNYPEHLEQKIGFDKIRLYLENNCETQLAKEESADFTFSSDLPSIQISLAETQEFTDLLAFEKSFVWVTPNDLRQEVKRAMIPGTHLPAQTILDIRENYKAVSAILRFFEKSKEDLYPHLKEIIREVKLFPFVLEKIDSVFNKQGVVKDSASKALSNIRASLGQKTKGVSKKMQSIVEKARKEGWVDQDTSPALRDGRLVVPLPVTHKRRLNGLIHDESASGKTVYVEPVELIELNNEIRELELAERREIVKILIQLTDAIRPYFEDILAWPKMIGRLDFIRAKARVCKSWNGNRMALTEERQVDWKSARHPLLVLSYSGQGKPVVAQDIFLNEENRILLISGPNAGGKSVCLKTVGLVQYMVQCGLLPPVQEGSVTTVFENIFIDIGDDQSLENDLSTYSSHLYSMNYFVKHAGPASLLLIDEFGTGTEPQLGAAIAQSILGKLNASRAYGVITTHYSNLKHFAASENGIINGAMLYDAQNLKPLFRLEIGKPGSSFAFEIAKQIGLPDDILDNAKEQVGSDYIQFDKHLREISRDKRYWEKKRTQIKKQEKSLAKLLNEYEEMIQVFEKEKKKKITDIQSESDILLNQINKRIENTIQEIRKSQADKEKARLERQKIANFAQETRTRLKNKEKQSDTDLSDLRSRQHQIRSVHLADGENSQSTSAESKPPATDIFVPGTKVRLIDRDVIGEVLKVNKKTVLVSVGHVMTTLPHDQISPISEDQFAAKVKQDDSMRLGRSWQDMEQKRLHFSTNIDLRGTRAEDAMQRIQELLDDAIMFEEHHLRILHGKGNGILREVVRQFLAATPVVKSYRDEDIRFGGSGITIVELDF